MQKKLADSTLLIDWAKELKAGRPGPVDAFVRAHRPFAYSVIAMGEYLEGEGQREAAEKFLEQFDPPLAITKQHAWRAATIQRRRKARGKRLGENDAWHAAVALVHGYTLVTRERRAFADIPGLHVIPHPKSGN